LATIVAEIWAKQTTCHLPRQRTRCLLLSWLLDPKQLGLTWLPDSLPLVWHNWETYESYVWNGCQTQQHGSNNTTKTRCLDLAWLLDSWVLGLTWILDLRLLDMVSHQAQEPVKKSKIKKMNKTSSFLICSENLF
jgi:hypothetical protein